MTEEETSIGVGVGVGCAHLVLALVGVAQIVRLHVKSSASDRLMASKVVFYLAATSLLAKGLTTAALRVPHCHHSDARLYSLKKLSAVGALWLTVLTLAAAAAFFVKFLRVLARVAARGGHVSYRPDCAAAATALLTMVIALTFVVCVVLITTVDHRKQCDLMEGIAVLCGVCYVVLASLLGAYGVRAFLFMFRERIGTAWHRTRLVVLIGVAASLFVAHGVVNIVQVIVRKDVDITAGNRAVLTNSSMELVAIAALFWLMWPMTGRKAMVNDFQQQHSQSPDR
jgi:hypothetical protein